MHLVHPSDTFDSKHYRDPSTHSQERRPKAMRLTLKLHPYPVRHALNTPLPHSLVQLRVNPDILSTHSLLCECDDGLDAGRCTLLEGLAVDALVQVNGVFASDDILKGRALLAAGLHYMTSWSASSLTECTMKFRV